LRNLTHTPLLIFPDLFQPQGTCNHNQTCVAYLLQVNMKGELWKMDYSLGMPPNEILCIQPRGNFITMKFPPTVDLELTKVVGYVNTVRRWYIPCLHLVDHILLWESRSSIAWDSSSPYWSFNQVHNDLQYHRSIVRILSEFQTLNVLAWIQLSEI
jgi:hypothetical protein